MSMKTGSKNGTYLLQKITRAVEGGHMFIVKQA
jgi:hypothetical protein